MEIGGRTGVKIQNVLNASLTIRSIKKLPEPRHEGAAPPLVVEAPALMFALIFPHLNHSLHLSEKPKWLNPSSESHFRMCGMLRASGHQHCSPKDGSE
jgi:hypothetical protein